VKRSSDQTELLKYRNLTKFGEIFFTQPLDQILVLNIIIQE